MVYKQKKSIQQQKQKETMQRIRDRGHFYIEGTYLNQTSPLVVYCPFHATENLTTFNNYRRSRTGCLCCGRQRVSTALTNREFSEEARDLMSQSALSRPDRGGRPRRWREESKYRIWRKKVLKNGGNKCVLTGKTEKLECHHLYGTNQYEDIIYVPENGIVLTHDIHVEFHRLFSYRGNTLEQFESFVLNLAKHGNAAMLISSQAVDGVLKDLETRKKLLKQSNNSFNKSTEGSETRW